MICFEIWKNGKRACVAGLRERGVLTTTIYGAFSGEQDEQPAPAQIRLNVGGVVHGSVDRLTWVNETLSLGDSVMVKVVELSETDRPEVTTPGGAGPVN